jgi:hypothetical protein
MTLMRRMVALLRSLEQADSAMVDGGHRTPWLPVSLIADQNVSPARLGCLP